MKYIILFISLFTVFSALAQSYQDEWKKQKMYPYEIKKGDTLSHILNKHGYHNIYQNMKTQKYYNPIHLTLWKNGLTQKDLKELKVGSIIYLPINYKGKRAIASVPSLMADIPEKEIKKIVIEYSNQN